MMRVLGADVVGMSLIPEVIVARHAGMQVLAFAVVSNFAAGLAGEELAHDEVKDVVGAMADRMCDLLSGIVTRW
jgi:purine-nucleoside phosphorylase